jgi:hypothetical protein
MTKNVTETNPPNILWLKCQVCGTELKLGTDIPDGYFPIMLERVSEIVVERQKFLNEHNSDAHSQVRFLKPTPNTGLNHARSIS